MQWEYNQTNFDRNLAVVIGIDRYQSDSIHDLSTPVSDARAIADLLETEYEYKPGNVLRLFDKDATLTGLQTLLTDTLPKLKPGKYDRLIFYFAGHGIPCNSKEGPKGYLVPQDADWQKQNSFLSMSEMYETLSKLECHHLLVILDCCFAGTFRWASSRKMIPILETVRREHYDRFIRYPAWQVITSAAHDQEALDVVKLAEDKRGEVAGEQQELHSPFALALLEGLREKKADMIRDGVITAHELYLYLENRVSELSGDRQKPGIYPLKLDYDRGEFVFTKPRFDPIINLKAAPPLNEENNPYRGLKPFEERHSRFFFGRKLLVEELSHRLCQSDRSLTVVLGASGCGKSSLVKAGLIPELRERSNPEVFALNLIQAGILTAAILAAFPRFPLKILPIYRVHQWYLLAPMRPERFPFRNLARAILPIEQPELIEQLSQVSFLDEVFKPKDETGQNDSNESTDAAFVKLANYWNSATPEDKILLVEDYFKQLKELCRNPQEQKQLSQLALAIFKQLKSLSNQLQNEPQYLTSAIEKWSETHPNTKLLLTIDQFEELITMSQESQTATHDGNKQKGNSPNKTVGDRAAESQPGLEFLQVLKRAIVECPQQLHILLTLRSDFEPRFLSSPLAADWKDARFPVRAMNFEELRQAIEAPALKQALYFEPPELASKLIDEVGQMPGALPLLSFALSELYIKLAQRWKENPNSSDRSITQADYQKLGGVTRSLTQRADQEYEALVKQDPACEQTIRNVMLRMVAVGGELARRRVPMTELEYPEPENTRVKTVIQRFSEARLLTNGTDSESQPYVEPAHDALVRGWQKLLEWKQQCLANVLLQVNLNPAAQQWANSSKNGSYRGLLWDNNPRLAQVKEQLELDPYWLNQQETSFVQDSLKWKRNKLTRLIITWLLVNSIVLGVAALALWNQNQSQKQRFNALIQSSEAFLSSQQQLKALENAIQAGESIKNGKSLMALWNQNSVFMPGLKLEHQAINSLQRIGHQIIQFNRWQAHTAPITTVSFDPKKGQTIASASEDGSIKIWNQDGSQLPKQTLKGQGKAVWSLSISPDGSTLISGSRDGKIRLWSKDSTGQFKLQPDRIFDEQHRHKSNILAVAFSPDGTVIASSGEDAKVSLWNKDGTWLRDLDNSQDKHKDAVYSVSFSPSNGSELVTAGKDGIKLWKIDGTFVKNIFANNNWSYGIAYSPDGSHIASGHSDGTIKLWKSDGTWIKDLTEHRNGVRAISFSPDSSKIVSAGQDRTVKLWDVKQETSIATFEGHVGDVRSVSFNAEGSLIASAGADNTIQLWQTKPILKKQVFSEHGDVVYVVDFSDDGLWVATASADKKVRVWRRNSEGTYETNSQLEGHKNRIYSLAFSPDNSTIASADEDGQILLWQLDKTGNFSKAKVRQPENLKYQIRGIAFNYDGSEMASTSSDKKVIIWKKQDNGSYKVFQTLSTATPENLPAYGLKVTFSPDNQILAVAHENGTVKVWKREINGQFEKEPFDSLSGHTGNVNQVAFSSDSSILASAGSDGTIRLWQRNSQGKYQSTKTFKGHNGGVYGLAFHPNGKMIASAGQDYTVKLWDLESGQAITLLEHTNRGFGVAFSPDGKTLASVGWDKKLILWNLDFLDLDSVLKQSCDWAKDYLQHSNYVDRSQPELCRNINR